MAVCVGGAAAVVLTVAVMVFLHRNGRKEPAAPKPSDATPVVQHTASTAMADSAGKAAKPSSRSTVSRKPRTTDRHAVPMAAMPTPKDPDALPPDPGGDRPIPIPGLANSPKKKDVKPPK